MPKLTLCMIVRNEEAMLADCLESARRAVDRMVIVDTGSTDGTREIIRSSGAELVEHEWNDDFAAARNAALERVASGYVLVLDADERLVRRGARALRAAARRGDLDLGLLPLHDARSLDAPPRDVVAGQARRGEPILLPRLLRRTPDLRYEGTVHESVAAWARRQRRVEVVNAPIVHYGAAPELRAGRGKAERNRELLERRCETEPENPTARAYLAAELRRAGDPHRALEQAREAWRIWRSLRAGGGPPPDAAAGQSPDAAAGQSPDAAAGDGRDPQDVVLAASVLGHLALRFAHWEECSRVMAEALEDERHPNLHLLAGLAEEQRVVRQGAGARSLERAADHYRRCLELEGRAFASEIMEGATSWQAATRLGTVLLLSGRPEEARQAFERALAARKDWPEGELGLAEATLATGSPEAALSLIEPRLEDPEAPADAWLIASQAALDLGAWDDARLLWERARELRDRKPFVGSHRYRIFTAVERELERRPREAPAAETRDEGAIRVFAWPCYDEPADLETLFGGFGRLLVDRPDLTLCLRHDPALDGRSERVEFRIAEAFEAHLGTGHDLHVMLIEKPAEAAAPLASPRDVALELPHTRGVRSAFLDALGRPRMASPEALERVLLAEGGSESAPTVPGPPTADPAEVEIEIAGRAVRFVYPAAPGLEPFVRAVLAGEDYPIVFPGVFEASTIVDIGAHAGAATVYLKSHYPEAEVFAFEPSTRACEHLLANVRKLGGVAVRQAALSDHAGDAKLFAGVHSSMQASLKPNQENRDRGETVPVLEARAVFEGLGRSGFSIVKIDTEGCEIEILASLDALLERIEVIYLEYHSERDRLEIDRRLTPRFLLHSARAAEPHRGTLTYVRADVAERCAARLAERCVFPRS